jgi:hypothetical protein
MAKHAGSLTKTHIPRPKTAGDLPSLRRSLWWALRWVEHMLNNPAQDDDTRLRCVHAMVQVATAYTKLVEATELAARVDALEKLLRKDT